MERGIVADLVDRPRLEGRHRGQPRLSQDRAQLQSDDGDRRQGHRRRGRASGASPARSTPTTSSRPGVYVQRIVHVPNADKHIEQRTVRKRDRMPAGTGRKSDGLDPRSDGRARRQGAARRLLRQSRHRHPDAGVELHSRRHERAAAERERHARHRPVSRTRARRTPTSSTPASRPSPSCRPPAISRQRRQLRHDPRRPHRPVHPRRHAGGRERRPRQLDDPRQDGEGHGRRHGPRRRRQEGRRGDGAFGQERAEAAQALHPAADRRRRGRHGDHRSRRVHHRQEGRRRHDAGRARARRRRSTRSRPRPRRATRSAQSSAEALAQDDSNRDRLAASAATKASQRRARLRLAAPAV